MNNTAITLEVMLREIRGYCQECIPELVAHPEYDAIITHLLQSPRHQTPLISHSDKTQVIEFALNLVENHEADQV